MTYLASPYTHDDPAIRHARFLKAIEAAGQRMLQGEVVYSPIVHGHPIALTFELPTDWEYWQKVCTTMIARSSKVVVLKIDGWKDSRGIAAEIKIAESIGIPVFYQEP